jgi:biopolymer transport protein ExbD
MRFPHSTKIFRGQLDVAPFVSVLFLLVIFLLLQSSLIFTPGVVVRLPEASDLPGSGRPSVVVTVDQTGNFYFENQICDEARLKARLRLAVSKSREPLALVVKIDRDARAGAWLRLGVIARDAGIREMVQAARPPLAPVPASAVPPP